MNPGPRYLHLVAAALAILVLNVPRRPVVAQQATHRDSESRFSAPCARSVSGKVALDGSLLAVARTSLHRVTLFDIHVRPPRLVASIGNYGEGASEFREPCGVAFDRRRRLLLVSDRGNDRVQVFKLESDAAGMGSRLVFGKAFGRSGDGPGLFQKPCAIATDDRGKAYVIEDATGRLQVFNAAHRFVRQWMVAPRDESPEATNFDLAVEADRDHLYVLDSPRKRISAFTSEGRPLDLSALARAVALLLYPAGLGLGGSGEIYVSDCGAHRLHAFDHAGQPRGVWGGIGGSSGRFIKPRQCAYDGKAGTVLVLDQGGARVQMFATTGELRSEFALPE
jgi:sugar lactone lactonase YvrE